MKVSSSLLKTTYKLKKSSLVTGIFIIVMAIISDTSFSFHDIAQKSLLSIIALFGMIQWLNLKKNNIEQRLFRTALGSFLPFGIAFIYTFIIVTINNQYQLPIQMQAFTSTVYAAVQMFFAATIVCMLKYKTIDIVADYVILSYVFTMIRVFYNYSLEEIQSKYSTIYNLLEKHDIGVAVVPLLLYYIFSIAYRKVRESERRNACVKIAALSIVMILCGKKAAYLSLAIGIVVMYMICWRLKNKVTFVRILTVISIICLYGYIIIIHSGLLIAVCEHFDIKIVGRVSVWDWFREQYSIMPWYLGKGFQYVHLYMVNNIAGNRSGYSMVTEFGYLHNSDLQIFIELGFWGFLFWFFYYLYIFPNRIRRRFGNESYYLCVMLQISMVVMYMVDNVLTYPVYQTTVYAVLLSHCSMYTIKNRNNEVVNNVKYESIRCISDNIVKKGKLL